MQDAMSRVEQSVLAQTLKEVLNESQLADLRVLIEAAGHWADELLNHMAPTLEELRDFDSAYIQRDRAMDIGNALNRFDAVR